MNFDLKNPKLLKFLAYFKNMLFSTISGQISKISASTYRHDTACIQFSNKSLTWSHNTTTIVFKKLYHFSLLVFILKQILYARQLICIINNIIPVYNTLDNISHMFPKTRNKTTALSFVN